MKYKSYIITHDVGEVYILFGDVPRSDGNNIIGIYQDESTANHAKEFWDERLPDTELSIELHNIWQEE